MVLFFCIWATLVNRLACFRDGPDGHLGPEMHDGSDEHEGPPDYERSERENFQFGWSGHGKGNDKNKVEQLPLHLAARMGDVEMARQLIGNGSDVNKRDKFNNTPLHDACSHSKDQKFSNVSKRTTRSLNFAFSGHLQVVDLLIENNADVNAKNNNQDTPLHMAASGGKLYH